MEEEKLEPSRSQTIALFFTGGTIAMKLGRDDQGVIPDAQFENLVNELSVMTPDVQIKAVNWADLPSPHMTPEQMFRLAMDVKKALQDPTIIGSVIVHGTDVMEETAFMTDLVLDFRKPVIFTGAMRYYDEPGFDGLRNLLYSIKVCQSRESANLGTMILMTDRLYSAREAIKIHSLNVDAFDAPGMGPLGFFEGERLQIIRFPRHRQTIQTDWIEPNVGLLKLYTGMDSGLIHFFRDNKAAGLVLEGFGSGNIPFKVIEAVEGLIDRNIPVVLSSRCIQGGAWPIYGYPGGGKYLHHRGVILAGRLSGQKARIQLMVALARTKNLKELRKIFKGTWDDRE
jgi:L-asparaginase